MLFLTCRLENKLMQILVYINLVIFVVQLIFAVGYI